jgi:Na+/phosphate symporter
MHKEYDFDKEQTDKLKEFNDKIRKLFNFADGLLKTRSYNNLDELVIRRDELINLSNDLLRSRIKILKKARKSVKVSVTYMDMLSETKNLLLNVVQLVKAEVNLLESIKSEKRPFVEE